MVEGFSWDTVQVIDENQILSLKKYVQDNQLNIDVKSLEEGNGVLIIHDHMLTPEQQNLQMKQLENRYILKRCFQKKMQFVEKNKIILIVKRNNRKTISYKRNPQHLLYAVI